jgi:hypothetical protein
LPVRCAFLQCVKLPCCCAGSHCFGGRGCQGHHVRTVAFI